MPTDQQKTLGQPHQCASCGNFQSESFCSFCGEMRLNAKHRSLTYLVGDLFESFTSLENKLLKSLFSFFAHPGELALNYHLGRRVGYMKPVAFFLIVNLVYVLTTPLSDFNVSFYDQLHSQSYSPYMKPWVLQWIDWLNLDYKMASQSYQQVTAVLSRSLIIISAPLLAIFAALIYRKKGYFFADHLVFSMYIYAWVMFWIVFAQLPAYLLVAISDFFSSDAISEMIYFDLLLVGLLAYILLASRKCYQLSWLGSLLRLPFAMLGLFLSHFLYRFVQLIISLLVVFYEAS